MYSRCFSHALSFCANKYLDQLGTNLGAYCFEIIRRIIYTKNSSVCISGHTVIFYMESQWLSKIVKNTPCSLLRQVLRKIRAKRVILRQRERKTLPIARYFIA